MVILPPFLRLEGQTSYSVESKPWPPHNSLMRMEGNDHGHPTTLCWEMEGCGYGHTHSLKMLWPHPQTLRSPGSTARGNSGAPRRFSFKRGLPAPNTGALDLDSSPEPEDALSKRAKTSTWSGGSPRNQSRSQPSMRDSRHKGRLPSPNESRMQQLKTCGVVEPDRGLSRGMLPCRVVSLSKKRPSRRTLLPPWKAERRWESRLASSTMSLPRFFPRCKGRDLMVSALDGVLK